MHVSATGDSDWGFILVQVGLGQQGRCPHALASGHTTLLEVAPRSETLLRTLSGEMAVAAVTQESKRFRIFFLPLPAQ